MVTEKNNFSWNAQHNFAKGNVIFKGKNEKPWKNEIEKCRPPPILRGPAPAPYFHPLFLIFQIPPSRGGKQNLLLPALQRRGFQTMLHTIFVRKTNLKFDLLSLNIFGSSEYEKMDIFLKQLNFALLTKNFLRLLTYNRKYKNCL